MRHIATFYVDWYGLGTLRVKLMSVSLLILSKPTGFNKPYPTIVTEDSRYEGFHLLCDLLVGSLILLDTLKNAILTINLVSQLSGVMVFVVKSKLGFDPDRPVEFSLYVTNLHILLRPAYF